MAAVAASTLARCNNRDTLLQQMMAHINISFSKQLDELHYQIIQRETLVDETVVARLLSMQDMLKLYYHSDMLSCLHANCARKQRNPGVCMVRQILKVNGMLMRPHQQSMGYNKTNGKKRVKRYYVVTPAHDGLLT